MRGSVDQNALTLAGAQRRQGKTGGKTGGKRGGNGNGKRGGSGHGFQDRFGLDLGKTLVLQADGQKEVAEAIQGKPREKFGGEVQRETAAIAVELLLKHLAIQRGDEADQFFDLVAGEHKKSPMH